MSLSFDRKSYEASCTEKMSISVEVFDENTIAKDKLLGRTVIYIDKLEEEKQKKFWVRISVLSIFPSSYSSYV